MPLQNWQSLGRECFDIRIGVGISSESIASLVCRVKTGSTWRGVLFRFNTVHSNMLSNRTPWITGKPVPAQASALQRLSEQWECRSIGSLLAEPRSLPFGLTTWPLVVGLATSGECGIV